jgi:hypothetical protein
VKLTNNLLKNITKRQTGATFKILRDIEIKPQPRRSFTAVQPRRDSLIPKKRRYASKGY